VFCSPSIAGILLDKGKWGSFEKRFGLGQFAAGMGQAFVIALFTIAADDNGKWRPRLRKLYRLKHRAPMEPARLCRRRLRDLPAISD
jgi:hypothetical protein